MAPAHTPLSLSLHTHTHRAGIARRGARARGAGARRLARMVKTGVQPRETWGGCVGRGRGRRAGWGRDEEAGWRGPVARALTGRWSLQPPTRAPWARVTAWQSWNAGECTRWCRAVLGETRGAHLETVRLRERGRVGCVVSFVHVETSLSLPTALGRLCRKSLFFCVCTLAPVTPKEIKKKKLSGDRQTKRRLRKKEKTLSPAHTTHTLLNHSISFLIKPTRGPPSSG